MTKAKPARHVAVALIFSSSTHRLLMITSRKHPHLWICEPLQASANLVQQLMTICLSVPKGKVEEGETSGQAAVREAWEEGASSRQHNPQNTLLSAQSAGTPQTLAAPTDDQRLLMLALEPVPSQLRRSVWHIHVLEVTEDEVDQVTEW